MLLSNKVLKYERLKLSMKKFYGWNAIFSNNMKSPFSRLLNVILQLDHIQRDPQPDF